MLITLLRAGALKCVFRTLLCQYLPLCCATFDCMGIHCMHTSQIIGLASERPLSTTQRKTAA